MDELEKVVFKVFLVLALVGFASLLLPGCAMSPETRVEETVYLATVAVDTGQTVDLHCHAHRHEADIPMIIGREPSYHSTYLWMGGASVAHTAITTYLSMHASQRWVRAWEALSLGFEGTTVVLNARLRP